MTSTHNNARRENDEDRDQKIEDSTTTSYGPELMEEDTFLEVRSSLNKNEKNEVIAEKLVDKVSFPKHSIYLKKKN
jgi:hypothetical protein